MRLINYEHFVVFNGQKHSILFPMYNCPQVSTLPINRQGINCVLSKFYYCRSIAPCNYHLMCDVRFDRVFFFLIIDFLPY